MSLINNENCISFIRELFNNTDIVLGHTLFPCAEEGGDIFLNPYVNWTLYPYKDEGAPQIFFKFVLHDQSKHIFTFIISIQVLRV